MNKRLHYIDWLRVLAFLTLILFHCAVPFVENYTWEINNEETSPLITRIIWWTHQWRLPLLFFIAGVGVRFSLKRRSVLKFFGERTLRLLVPLVFAIFCITPFQVYFEWLQKGRHNLSFAEFYPQVFEIVPYPDGAFTWSHMWFVAYLFVFTILLLPVFSLAKVKWFQRGIPLVSKLFDSPFVLLSFALPFMMYIFLLFIDWPEQGSLISDWYVFLSSMTFYLLGFVLSAVSSFWETCMKYRKLFLSIASVLAIVLIVQYYWNWSINRPQAQDVNLYVYGALNSIHIWTIILSAIGYAMKHLNYSNRYLSYLNTAIYPFYILHQGVIVASGYYILQLEVGIFFKLLLLVITCMLTIWVCYHFIIKNTMVTRILFGMKWRKLKK